MNWGDFGESLFTGRWTGGENSVADQFKADPWGVGAVLAAPALIGGAALGAGALGAGALGAGAAEAGVEGGAMAFAPELAGAGEATAGTLPEWLAAPGGALTPAETVAGDFGALGYGPSGGAAAGGAPLDLSAPAASIDQLLPPGGAMPVSGSPMSLAPPAGGSGAAGGAGAPSAWETLTSPSKWTLGGVAQGGAIGIGALGLGANMLKGNSKGAAEDRLTNVGAFGISQAQSAIAESKQLRSYLENGNLPGPLQAQVDQAVKAQKARLISNAAKNGNSTDPTQNTALAQDLQAAEMMGIQMAGTLEKDLFTAGQQMLTEGLNFAGLSAKMYEVLAGFDRTDTANLNAAIANLSGAMAKSSGGINLKVG